MCLSFPPSYQGIVPQSKRHTQGHIKRGSPLRVWCEKKRAFCRQKVPLKSLGRTPHLKVFATVWILKIKELSFRSRAHLPFFSLQGLLTKTKLRMVERNELCCCGFHTEERLAVQRRGNGPPLWGRTVDRAIEHRHAEEHGKPLSRSNILFSCGHSEATELWGGHHELESRQNMVASPSPACSYHFIS